MANKILGKVLCIVTVLLYIGFTSCGNDDGEKDKLIGEWVNWELDDNLAQGYTYKNRCTWEFKADGTGTFNSVGSYYSKIDKTWDNWDDSNTFRYTKNGNNAGTVSLSITSAHGSDYNYKVGSELNWNYSIDGNILRLDNKDYITAAQVVEPVSEEVNVTLPGISVVVAAATVTQFDVTFKVESEEYPSSCILYYAPAYYYPYEQPANFQSRACRMERDLDGNSGKHIYYYTGWAAGLAGATAGSRLYYYAEVTNSAGTTRTPVQNVSIHGGMVY